MESPNRPTMLEDVWLRYIDGDTSMEVQLAIRSLARNDLTRHLVAKFGRLQELDSIVNDALHTGMSKRKDYRREYLTPIHWLKTIAESKAIDEYRRSNTLALGGTGAKKPVRMSSRWHKGENREEAEGRIRRACRRSSSRIGGPVELMPTSWPEMKARFSANWNDRRHPAKPSRLWLDLKPEEQAMLSSREGAVLTCLDGEELTYKATAKRLGLTITQVKNAAHDARKKIQAVRDVKVKPLESIDNAAVERDNRSRHAGIIPESIAA